MPERLPPALRAELAALPPQEQDVLARVWALTERAAPLPPAVGPPPVEAVLATALAGPSPLLSAAADRGPLPRRTLRSRTWAQIGALLGVAALGAVVVMQWPARPVAPGTALVRKSAAAGERDELRLADGTSVALSGATQIEARVGDTRRVTLSGEAYFDVAHDPARPFVIEASGVTLQVLGTAFNVRAYPGRSVEVAVERGRVAVVRGTHRVELTAGQHVVATLGQMTPQPVPHDVAAWRTGGFYLDDAPLSDIATEIERRYGTRVVLDGELASRRWTLGVPNATSDTLVLDALAAGLGVRVERTADGVRLAK